MQTSSIKLFNEVFFNILCPPYKSELINFTFFEQFFAVEFSLKWKFIKVSQNNIFIFKLNELFIGFFLQ